MKSMIIDGFVQAQQAFFDQRHRRGGGDGLGERGDPKDGVAPQGRVVGEGRRADGVDVHIIA